MHRVLQYTRVLHEQEVLYVHLLQTISNQGEAILLTAQTNIHCTYLNPAKGTANQVPCLESLA